MSFVIWLNRLRSLCYATEIYMDKKQLTKSYEIYLCLYQAVTGTEEYQTWSVLKAELMEALSR